MNTIDDDVKNDSQQQNQKESISDVKDPKKQHDVKRNEEKSIAERFQPFRLSNIPAFGMANFKKPDKGYAQIDGKMSMESQFTLHTKIGCSLWRGREGKPNKGVYAITGLTRFAQEVGTCWRESELNNPVADYFLLRVEQRYEKTVSVIDGALKTLQTIIDDDTVYDLISIGETHRPFKTNLQFSCPWGYLGAILLKKYDDIVRIGLTLRHVGMLDAPSWRLLVDESGTSLRGFYSSLSNFIRVPIDREWFRNKELRDNISQARKYYKMANREIPHLPEKVLKGQERAKLSPQILSKQKRDKKREADAFDAGSMKLLITAMGIRKAEANEIRKQKRDARKRAMQAKRRRKQQES